MGLGRLASRPALRHENAAADPDGSSVRRSVAQWLEHRSPKPGAGGSSPSTPATYSSNQLISFGCDTAGRFGATILVRGAVRRQQRHSLAGHPISVGRVGVRLRLRRGEPFDAPAFGPGPGDPANAL